MNHFSTTYTNADTVLGTPRRSYVVDQKLSAFVLFDGLINHDSSSIGVERMTEAIMGTLYTHARVIQKNHDHPSYSNRIRAALIIELAMLDAQREYLMLRKEFQDSPDVAPRVALMVFMGEQVSIMHSGVRGLYRIRNGSMQRLASATPAPGDSDRSKSAPPASASPAPGSRAGSADSSSASVPGSRSGSGSGPRAGNGLTGSARPTASTLELIHVDVRPADVFLMGTDSLDRVIVDPQQVGQQVKRVDDINQMLQQLVKLAVVETPQVISGVMIKTLSTGPVRPKELTARMEIFRELCPLQHFNDDELLRILKLMKFAQFNPGDQIIVEGSKSDKIFIALTGRFKIIRSGTIIAEAGPGTCFGEISLLCDIPHTADVVVSETAKVVTMSHEDFKRINDQDPQMGGRMIWQLSTLLAERLVGSTDTIVTWAKQAASMATPVPRKVVATGERPERPERPHRT